MKELVISTVAMETHCSDWCQTTIGSGDTELKYIKDVLNKQRALAYQLVEVCVTAFETCLYVSKSKKIAIVMAGLQGQVGRVVPVIHSLQCSFPLSN